MRDLFVFVLIVIERAIVLPVRVAEQNDAVRSAGCFFCRCQLERWNHHLRGVPLLRLRLRRVG